VFVYCLSIHYNGIYKLLHLSFASYLTLSLYFAFCQHTGVSHRKAILRFLLQFDSNELHLFFSLLLKSLIPGSLQHKIIGFKSENLLGNASDIVGTSPEICIENFTWKKANGFVHLVEDIFGTFDMAHISPFLNFLLIIVARLLESCMRNLKSDNDGEYPSKQSNDHDNDCSVNMEVDNSANVDGCPEEMHVGDHMEVYLIVAFMCALIIQFYSSAIYFLQVRNCCRFGQ